ncbi:glycosyltransferase [Oscillatoria sp. FACHB-1407]|uniref:glycosyltransferase family 2 protein n=1 Tax=Oscillatoria sp. FACHB-1407 TaxID=2692847 RepID=UPI00168455C8|nr:glycosyltransferase [Oscillatoria sp. FACHB-1407]MBD2464446.1 glycosyltransferase [Oscillatoria sp. FACHB-1407]
MSLISVIIPAYNAADTISETIASVLNQTYSNLELIVIDDGSQDATVDIVTAIADPRIQVFSYPNSGVAISRNRGLTHATGDFIAFLDADDIWTPDKLEAQRQALQANPNAKVAYCWTDWIDHNSDRIGPCCHITANGNVYAALLLSCFVVSGSNPLIAREAILDVGGFDETLTASQDFDLYLRLAARYEFVAVPSPKVLYRRLPNSMSTNLKRWETTSLLVREKYFEKAPEPLPRSLRRHSIGNFYKAMIFRILNDPPHPKQGVEALRVLGQNLRYDSRLLHQRITLKLLAKAVLMMVLPPAIATQLFTRFKALSNINAIVSLTISDPRLLT